MAGYRRCVWRARACWVVMALVLPLAGAGCTTVVAGSAAPAAPRIDGLDADVLADECLLTAAEFGELVDLPVQPPEQGAVDRGDGSRSAACVVVAGAEPVALVNVYGVRAGAPADYVRAAGAAGRRELPGVGAGAAVIGTAAGPTLQLAGERYLVTILVSGSVPSDEEWRAAAEAALSRLPV
ncbi:hypothetical protein FHX44_116145 [Pseudonocardia hierapolitana]|uniref:DUF2020 domain-containing protein n=1 Tax=Pseudonocardia hierapolitana TaxID=1128676 RepID=A0A561SZC1_9PSEU|nr:hypothetical protein FHX44_116145 [Pseudonocardia hierapolitana]